MQTVSPDASWFCHMVCLKKKQTTKHQKEVNPIRNTWVLVYVSVILKRVVHDSSKFRSTCGYEGQTCPTCSGDKERNLVSSKGRQDMLPDFLKQVIC